MSGALLVARIALALLFLTAAIAKLADRGSLKSTLREFRVPAAVVGPASWALPLTELAIAVFLIPAPTAQAAAGLALGVLIVFSAAMIISLRRDERPDCNCFGRVHSAPVGPGALARNGLLGAAAATVAVAGPGEGLGGVELSPETAYAIGTVVAIAALAWFSWQLFRQNGRLLARVKVLELVVAGGRDPSQGEAGLAEGEAVPPFALPTLDGQSRSLDDLLAPRRPLALVFADPDCEACGPLLGDLGDLQLERAGLEIAIVTRRDPKLRSQLNGGGIATVLLQEDHEVAEACRVRGVPGAFIVGADGRVASPLASGGPQIERLIRSWPAPRVPQGATNGGSHR